MNLEAIEQEVLSYLKQVTNPLVRVDLLLERLHQKEEFSPLTEGDLLDFLRHHELFRVLDPVIPENGEETSRRLAEAGFIQGPSVVLDTRVPTPAQTADMMARQLASLDDALKTAIAQARDRGDEESILKLRAALERSSSIRDRLSSLDSLGESAR